MKHVRSGVIRVSRIATTLFRHGLRHMRDMLRGAGGSGPARLRALLEDLGGTFIKFGQMLSLQPDVLPPAYCQALNDLLDRVRPFDFPQVEQIFREEFGRGPSQVFEEFSRLPIATASIGQVHRARLSGRTLAVKIQRPDAEHDFPIDLALLAGAVGSIRGLHIRPLRWLVEPTTEFIFWTREELDFSSEADYMSRLHRRSAGRKGEHVPSLVRELSTRRILTCDYLEGPTVLDYMRARAAGDHGTLSRIASLGFQPNRFARQVTENFLHDAFTHGLFHADVHPANLVILEDNEVGYVDFGITGTISEFSRRQLMRLTLAYARRDIDAIYKSFLRIAAPDRHADPEGFRKGLERLAEGWYWANAQSRNQRPSLTVVMFDLLALSRMTHLLPEREVVRYIRSAITLDGLVKTFAPDFDSAAHLEAAVSRHLAEHKDEATARALWEGLFAISDAGRQTLAGGMAAFSPRIRERIRETSVRVRLATAVLVASLLMSFYPEGSGLGLNPLTAELLVAVAGVIGILFVSFSSRGS